MVENTGKTRTPAVPGVLDDPILNRGAAFSAAEREALGLTGRLPSAVLTLEAQAQRAYRQLQDQGSDLAKLLPVVYDPTVGEAIEKYSHEYRRPRGVYLSIDRPDDIAAAFGTLEFG